MKPLVLSLACLAALGPVMLAGCSCYQLRDECDRCATGVRNKHLACQAWNRRESCFRNVAYPHHFEKGFKAGYIAVASGAGQCPPTMPPRSYWGVHYQGPEGRAQVNAWFDGHSQGRLAAELDGVADMNRIPFRNACGGNCLPTGLPITPLPGSALVPGTGFLPPSPAPPMLPGPTPELAPSLIDDLLPEVGPNLPEAIEPAGELPPGDVLPGYETPRSPAPQPPAAPPIEAFPEDGFSGGGFDDTRGTIRPASAPDATAAQEFGWQEPTDDGFSEVSQTGLWGMPTSENVELGNLSYRRATRPAAGSSPAVWPAP